MNTGQVTKILKFETPDCTWCKVASPHIVTYADDKGYALETINAAENKEAAARYNVMGVPAMILVDAEENTIEACIGYPAIYVKINE